MGDSEIQETYLNSVSKNTLETDIFPHGTKSLLTSVIENIVNSPLCHCHGSPVEDCNRQLLYFMSICNMQDDKCCRLMAYIPDLYE